MKKFNFWPVLLISLTVSFGLILVLILTSLYETDIAEPPTSKFLNQNTSQSAVKLKDTSEYAELRKEIESAIDSAVLRGQAKDASVYFKDLTNGKWVAINGDEFYAPASLLKVPLMIAYFKYAESRSAIFSKRIVYVSSTYDNVASDFPTSIPQLEKGKSYSVDELIQRMIIYSGNKSMDLLFRNLDEEYIKDVFADIGLVIPNFSQFGDTVSVRDYVHIFSTLYYSSYLNQKFSQRALALLAKTTFKDGLVAGVPADINVAHKFGERGIQQDDGSIVRELHDCGIVYYPNQPYILCVMTHGKAWKDLESVIGTISRIVYNAEVSSR